MESLRAHSQFFRKSRESGLVITDYEKETILYVLEKAYVKSKYVLEDDFMSYAKFRDVVRDLEMKSSPGYPYSLSASSIGEWLGFDGVTWNEARVEELWYDMLAFVSGERDSVYRVFVKREPHTRKKADAKRWRLIICPPLYEQVAWSLVFGPGNDKQIETVGFTPSMQGMYLIGGAWKWHKRLFESRGLTAAMDKSAFDWTAHIELIELDLELRERLITSGPVVEWRRIAEHLYRGAFYHPRLMLSNGEVYEQTVPGIVKSGCVNTISLNSHIQLIAHVLLCLRNNLPVHPLPVAVGDDTLVSLENTPSAEAYATAGIVVKELVPGLHFVGHTFEDYGPVPRYGAKHLYRFLEVSEEIVPDFLDSMVRLYAHVDGFAAAWRMIASKRGVVLPSPSYVKYWYDYPTEFIDMSRLAALLR